MYSTCIFCHTPLGANEAIEQFPVGRRLAFDAAKGRLWVVCRRCARWNLSPLETRWEAIEECERLFRDTKLRVSTGHIGLARVREGTDLVRIGEPQRPEMAAWRYGDQFGRRRRRTVAVLTAGITLPAVALAFPVIVNATGMVSGILAAAAGLGANLTALALYALRYRISARMRTSAGEYLRFHNRALNALTLVRDSGTAFGWSVGIHPRRTFLRFPTRDRLAGRVLAGADAVSALRVALPAINADGGNAEMVRASVGLLERFELPALLAENEKIQSSIESLTGTPMRLSHSPYVLALEMALHEEDERRALEGELALLERRWREAEEIAAIADDLLLPSSLRVRLDRLRRD